MDRPTCKTCPYWRKQYEDDTSGTCQRRSPQAVRRDYPTFAETHESSWCGEHPDFAAWMATQAKPNTPSPSVSRLGATTLHSLGDSVAYLYDSAVITVKDLQNGEIKRHRLEPIPNYPGLFRLGSEVAAWIESQKHNPNGESKS